MESSKEINISDIYKFSGVKIDIDHYKLIKQLQEFGCIPKEGKLFS